MEYVETTVEYLDDIRYNNDIAFFTVRNGKAKYNFLHVPDGTIGYYYAIRITDDNFKIVRALKPRTKIKCWLRNNL